MRSAFAGIIKNKFDGDRVPAEKDAAIKLARILQIKNYWDASVCYVLQNWVIFSLCKQKELVQNPPLKKTLKTLFTLKATGSEAAYIKALQKAVDLRKLLEELIKTYVI